MNKPFKGFLFQKNDALLLSAIRNPLTLCLLKLYMITAVFLSGVCLVVVGGGGKVGWVVAVGWVWVVVVFSIFLFVVGFVCYGGFLCACVCFVVVAVGLFVWDFLGCVLLVCWFPLNLRKCWITFWER